MAILPIVTYPSPILKQKSEKVGEITPEIQQLLNDMAETMYQAKGIGLAAVQVGLLKRIIVMDLSEERNELLYLINPEIIEYSAEEKDYEEGCLSLPGQYSSVKRPASIKLRYQDYNGKEQIMEADGLKAVCIQHEMDHLEGIILLDRVSKLKANMMRTKLLKKQK